MGHVKVSVPINAPMELAWKLSNDLERFPDWQTQLIEIKDVIGIYPAVGSAYVSVERIGGRQFETRTAVVEADPPRRLVQTVTIPGGHATFTTWFEQAPTGGLLATFEAQYELPGGFFGTLAEKLFFDRAMERSVRHTQENMKAMIEAEALVPA